MPVVRHYATDVVYSQPTSVNYYASTKILGDVSNLCSGNRVFNVKSITGATYTWTYSSTLSVIGATNTNQITLQRNGSANGSAWAEVQISSPCSATSVSNRVYFTVGTPSPYLGGTFNDGGYSVNQPLESTYNEIYNNTVYISLSGLPSEFTWDSFYSQGNVTWYHPVGNDGLIINFGPSPVYYGDYVGFSINRTNNCGTATEPLVFYYRGPSQYYSVAPNPVSSSFTINKINSQSKSAFPQKEELNIDLNKLQITDKMGNIILEKIYPSGTESATIDVSKILPDIYIVKLFTKNKVELHKIIVQH